ncbi:DUF721 domain-containing protein [Cyanobacterium stanieri LEGE 03274]|uniref:DUF721 domain-containing protein n=1 Tax=Cyanobacterium stanieri LEGE 03274 TaxID=1828756 RepID=A0ABR9V183_9CHRO|nr:DciA family protein [Cyanobacterium stanieri]MBE9221654.1 DUF721 domain-containing protein [Cyanobacterium stanieri LEGE 03274]
MTFESIDKLLNAILAQPQWETQRRYQQLVRCWFTVVNHRVAQHTKPIALRDDILWVSTSSSAYAQNLSLQRYTLLKKINRRLNESIKDIRFTTTKWYQKSWVDPEEETHLVNPSILHDQYQPPEKSSPVTPQEALEQWLNKIKGRSHSLPPCPRCQTPTPLGELERWGICGICFAKDHSSLNPRE